MGMPHVDRLRERAAELLGPSKQVDAAFVAQTGPRPGMEAVGSVAGVLGMLAVLRPRRYYTVAVTTDAVVLIRNKGELRPTAIERRLDKSNALGPVDGSGDYKISIDGDDYWVPLRWIDEARRAQRLAPRD